MTHFTQKTTKNQTGPAASAGCELIDLGHDGLHLGLFPDGSTMLTRRLKVSGKDFWIIPAGPDLVYDLARTADMAHGMGLKGGRR